MIEHRISLRNVGKINPASIEDYLARGGYEALKKALQTALQNNQAITDESSAMELAGFSPRLVEGKEDNIKITRPDDLRLASLYLESQLDE